MLNNSILTKMRAEILPPQIDVVVRALPGSAAVVAAVLDKVRSKIGDRPIVGQPVKPNASRARGGSAAGPTRARARTAGNVATATSSRRASATAPRTSTTAPRGSAILTRGSMGGGGNAAATPDGRKPVVPPMRTADGVLSARERQRRMSPPPAPPALGGSGGGASAAMPDARPSAAFRGGRNSMAPVPGAGRKLGAGSKAMSKAEFLKEFERRQRQEELERLEAAGTAAGGDDQFGARFDALMRRFKLPGGSTSPLGGSSELAVRQHRRMTEIADTLESARLKNVADLQLTEQRLTRMRLAEKKADTALVEHEVVKSCSKAFVPAEGWPGGGGGEERGEGGGELLGEGREEGYGGMDVGAEEECVGVLASGPSLRDGECGSDEAEGAIAVATGFDGHGGRSSTVESLRQAEEILKAELEQAKAELAAADFDGLPPPDDRLATRDARSESDMRRRGAHVGVPVEPVPVDEWVAGVDPASGHPYWYNNRTKQSQWTAPACGGFGPGGS